jgi:hypothetical protein
MRCRSRQPGYNCRVTHWRFPTVLW